MRITFGDHHSHDDVLETRQNKHAAVLHVGQVFCSNPRRIERKIPAVKTKPVDRNFTLLNPVICVRAGRAVRCAPFLRHGDEEGSQLAQDDHAGVKEDASQHGQRKQAGRRSAGVQLQAGASSPHQDGQKRHQAKVQEQELQVT